MTIRTQRRIAWGTYGLAAATGAAATPFVLALADWFPGLILVWAPLLAFAAVIYGATRQNLVGSFEPPDRESFGFSARFLLLLLDGYILYLAFPATALHREPDPRTWILTLIGILLIAVLLMPRPKDLHPPDRGLGRWLILRQRWIRPGILAIGLGLVAFGLNPSSAFVAINAFVGFTTWCSILSIQDEK